MRTRLIPVLLAGLLGATLVLAQQPPGQPPGLQPGKTDRADDRNDRPAGMASIEGNWTVVSCARDGRAVDGADKMTVTIKGNMVTFDGGTDKNPMRAMRLDFGPAGTLRVMEANPDGKFDTPGTPGVGTPPAPGAQPPAGTPPDRPPPSITPSPPGGVPQSPRPDARPGDTADRRLGMPGVYVLTPDYLAISVFEPAYASGAPPAGVRPGDRPGGVGTPPGAGIPPGGTTPPPGGTTPPATGTQPPAGTGTRPGETVAPLGGVGAAGQPQMRSHISVILKRSGGPGAPRP